LEKKMESWWKKYQNKKATHISFVGTNKIFPLIFTSKVCKMKWGLIKTSYRGASFKGRI
jgi:hypothetical protein